MKIQLSLLQNHSKCLNSYRKHAAWHFWQSNSIICILLFDTEVSPLSILHYSAFILSWACFSSLENTEKRVNDVIMATKPEKNRKNN